MAWLAGWNRRKFKIVNGKDVDRTDSIINITVYKGTGIDTTNTVYCGGNIKDDFTDIRFTKQDGTTPLRYKILSYQLGTAANVIVEIDYLPSLPGHTQIYMYYDNISAQESQTQTLSLRNIIHTINLNDGIPISTTLQSCNTFLDQTFTGTVPYYFDEAWVAQKGLTDYDHVVDNNNGIGADDIWILNINGINAFVIGKGTPTSMCGYYITEHTNYPTKPWLSINITNTMKNLLGQTINLNVLLVNASPIDQGGSSGAIYFISDPLATLGAWGIEELPCTLVTISADKMSAYVGETIIITTTAQPPTQSYNIEVRDQSNNVLGNCTVSGGVCSVNWNTTGFEAGLYALTAHILSPTECISTPVILTLLPTCSLVTITPDKTFANIGELITFNINVSPVSQSFNVQLIDQDNNTIGNICTTQIGTCTITWDTKDLSPKSYVITATVIDGSAGQCISTPVSITLQSPPSGGIMIFGILGVAALGMMMTAKKPK